jgi:SAM-dependent methyltransferase
MRSSEVERAQSLTHEHLLCILATEAHEQAPNRPLSILDLGCGEGRMLGYLARNLPRLLPAVQPSFYGLEAHDAGVQRSGFIERAGAYLASAAPETRWPDRIFGVSSTERWPFPDACFDFIVSNQVLEHVKDHWHVFSEMRRTLKQGGRAVHLFPLKHYWYEGHLWLMWVHRIQNADLRAAYLRLSSRLGLGKYLGHKRAFGMSLEQYSEMHADYIQFMTNYLTESETLAHAKHAGLRASFRYTQEFYYRKLRAVLGMSVPFQYSRSRNALTDWLWLKALKYVSGVTLFLEKKQTYVNPAEAAGH